VYENATLDWTRQDHIGARLGRFADQWLGPPGPAARLSRTFPTTEGNRRDGASSLAKPALIKSEPKSMTRIGSEVIAICDVKSTGNLELQGYRSIRGVSSVKEKADFVKSLKDRLSVIESIPAETYTASKHHGGNHLGRRIGVVGQAQRSNFDLSSLIHLE
jgi:hypothetical protein